MSGMAVLQIRGRLVNISGWARQKRAIAPSKKQAVLVPQAESLLPVHFFPQILIVLSELPLAKVWPSGLKATLLTESVCPVRVRKG